MTADDDSGGSGWTVWKVLGMIAALLGMVGFGFAGLCGLLIAGIVGPDTETVAIGVLGLVIAVALLFGAIAIARSTRRRS
jgi:ABC-type transport system involved in multi-copper enzyme maturation permease subunit